MEPVQENVPETDEREAALYQIKALMATHHISPQELGGATTTPGQLIASSPVVQTPEPQKPHLSIAETFYNVGAVIVLSGAWALVGINWADMSGVSKVLFSLLLVVFSYVVAVALSRVEVLKSVAPVFYLATIGTVPIVAIAILQALDVDTSTASSVLIISAISGLVALTGWFVHRIPLFVLGVIVYASIAYCAMAQLIIQGIPREADLLAWAFVVEFVVLGFAYGVFAFLSKKTLPSLKPFENALYAFGSLLILAALFTQTGWSPREVTVVGVLYPVIIFAMVLASALLKQSSILTSATIFLIIYIFKTTFMYFSDNIGWPMALMLSGLLTVATGIGANLLAKRLGLMKPKNSRATSRDEANS